AQNRNCSAVPQMLGIGLRCVLFAHEQADNNADVALLDSYIFLIISLEHGGLSRYTDRSTPHPILPMQMAQLLQITTGTLRRPQMLTLHQTDS
ncbi:MAG: hypothetical protein Q8J76_02765, partial [Desulfobulbaceae bacterium]|nr:hypothetical protein [Desulfobulbaceae bacterium]